ncbi:putative lipoprotein [Escherichia coli]|uniref:Putative lipoprotein n=1 Tax=Escherichia coli TaxID=562 RepID=A0A377BA34_ECOLX|nr:putative lipoprotein [Escherichia coli]
MFGVTLRTNFNDLRPSYNDNARPQYQPQPQMPFAAFGVANQLTLLKYNAGLPIHRSRRKAIRCMLPASR